MPYVDSLRQQLVAAAEAGSEETRETAERLATALEPAARLVLLDALSAAADEITRDVAPASVEVRLRGGQTDFIVTSPPTDEPFEESDGNGAGAEQRRSDGVATDDRSPAVPAPPETEEGGTSRITLRLPDHLKPRVEEAARSEGLSVNAWLVRALASALESDSRQSGRRASRRVGRGYTGWVR